MIAEERVPFLRALAEDPRDDFDGPAWGHSHDSFLSLSWSHVRQHMDPAGLDPRLVSRVGGYWMQRGGVELGLVHGTPWSEPGY